MDDKTIHLWDEHGARAGSFTISFQGSADASVYQVQLAVRGFKNLELWLQKVRDEIEQIVLTQKEIAERKDTPND